MVEISRIWLALLVVFVAACTTPEPVVVQRPPEAPVPPPAAPAIDPAVAQAALAEEARAMLAQAETDIQRARAKRALWQKAWEDLLAARQSVAARESEKAIRHARSASELALLGLEQLAYPPVK